MITTKGSLARSLTMLAYALADQYRWEVIFSAIGPCIDMTTRKVYLPRTWVSGSDSDAKLLMGLFYHEVLGHGIATDPTIPTSGPDITALMAGVRGVLEDIRIERAAATTYVGVARGLAETVAEMRERDLWQKPSALGHDGPAAVLTMGLCHILRAKHLSGQAVTLNPWVKVWHEQGVRRFGRNLWERVLRIGDEVAKARVDLAGTVEVNALAGRILALLKDAQRNPEQFSRSPSAGQPSLHGGAPAPGGGESAGHPSEDDGAQGDGKAPGKNPEAASRGGSGEQAGNGENEPEGGNSLPEGAAKGVVEPSADQLARTCGEALNATEVPVTQLEKLLATAIEKATGGTRGGVGDYSEVPRERSSISYADHFDQAAAVLARVCGREVERLLEAQATEKRWYTTSGLHLASRRLARIALADPRVFRRREEAEGVCTAVAMLTDESGSMEAQMAGWGGAGGSSRKHLAISTGYAMGRLLDRYDARWALASFGSKFSLVKGLDESTKACRFFQPGGIGGGTNTAEALMAILPSIGLADESKKLIIVSTDGEPGNADKTIAAIRECYRYGVQVLTLLLGTDGHRFEGRLRTEGFPSGRCTNATVFRDAVATAIAQAALLGLDLRAMRKLAA